MVSAQMVLMFGSRTSPTNPSSDPPSIHGRRRPNRDVVRSDSAPASGLPMTEPITPTPVTMASAVSLPPDPAICSDMRGSRFCSGAKKATMMPRLASARPDRNSPRTAAVGSASARTPACVTGSLMGHKVLPVDPYCGAEMFTIHSMPNRSVHCP